MAVMVGIVCAQSTAPSIVPIIKEPSHDMVLDNEYVRVFYVEVPPHAETQYHQHDKDYIFVTLGDSSVDSVRVGEKPVHLDLKDGDTRFTKGEFAHKAVNQSDKPFRNVTIELKSKYKLEQFGCNHNCKKEIKFKEVIGNSEELFSLGGSGDSVTRYHLFPAGSKTITHSYSRTYIAMDADLSVLIIAISEFDLEENGKKKSMKPGDVWFCTQCDPLITAGMNGADWIAIKL